MKKILVMALCAAMLLATTACSTTTGVQPITPESTETEAPIEEVGPTINDFNEIVPEEIAEAYPELQYFIAPEDYAMLQDIGDEALEEVIAYKDMLIEAVEELSERTDIKIDVDNKTGIVTFDADILFDFDKSELKDESKVNIDKFMNVYSVVLDTGFDAFISTLVFEGHTDSNGGDAINIPLSLERATAVKDYVLSDECGLTEEQKVQFESKLEAVGCGSERLVIDENGNEDADASRRVTFRFVFDLETILAAIENKLNLDNIGVDLSDIDVSGLELPDIDVSDLDIPDLPDYDETISDFSDIEVEIPEDLGLSDIDLSGLDISDVDLPELDINF